MANITDYWVEVEDLTIFHAAYWMEIGGDPRAHDYRCEHDTDNTYESHFYDHPGGYEAVCERCEGILSAIRVGLIKVTEGVQGSNHNFDPMNTRILKRDWINWCRTIPIQEIAELVEAFEGGREVPASRLIEGSAAKLALPDHQPESDAAAVSAPPAPQQPTSGRTVHRLGGTRTHALAAVISAATNSAPDPTDYQSVWASLVNLAESGTPPPPLLAGYVAEEGVKYQAENGVKFFTKNALRSMMKRAAEGAAR